MRGQAKEFDGFNEDMEFHDLPRVKDDIPEWVELETDEKKHVHKIACEQLKEENS